MLKCSPQRSKSMDWLCDDEVIITLFEYNMQKKTDFRLKIKQESDESKPCNHQGKLFAFLHFGKAIAAINRTVVMGLERNGSLCTT